jgi:hypothetical protein
MDLKKIGSVLVLLGCFALLVSPSLGMACIVLGAACIAVTEDKKETHVPVKPQIEEVRYKVVGDQVLMLDSDGYVIGAASTQESSKKCNTIEAGKIRRN